MAWKIKQKPSDFVVREVIHDATEESWKEKMARIRGLPAKREKEGQDGRKYLWMTMKKEDADFFSSIGAVARALCLGTRDVGYAGTKDRRAQTLQTISVPAEKEEEARVLKIPGIALSDFRRRGRAIRLGEHEGNSFVITVRNVPKSGRAKAEKRLAHMQKHGFINFFGSQRFGSVTGKNADIGKMLTLGDVEGTVKALTSGRPPKGSTEHAMKAYISKRPRDFRGALRLAPLRMLKLLVHAYQAKIWNECAEALLRMHAHKSARGKHAKSAPPENTQIPVVGHMTDTRTHPKVRRIVEDVLEKEKIGPEDFLNKAFRELSSRGSERDLICRPRDLSWAFGEDEDNPGKLSLTLSFFLQKGAYATELVRQLQSA